VGKLSIIGGCSKVIQDIPPFSTCDGYPARVYSLNFLGLKRSGVSPEAQMELKKAFRILFYSGLTITSGIKEVTRSLSLDFKEVSYLLDFLKDSERGICRGVDENRPNRGKR
jgi:UDP-N-acetylglucosamine acyltransferase